VLCKLRDLSLAFYWDESWVYAPSVKLMYAHGVSLMPRAVPVEYARGHPLLFQAMCAGWMHLFGTSNVAMHSFALFVAVMMAVVLYEVMLSLFGMRAAMMSVVLLLLNHMYFVDSSFVLNDIMLGLLFLLVIYFYVREKYIAAAVSLTLAFYTKESGLVVGCIIGADIVADIVRKRERRQIIYKSLSLAIPVLLIAVFFVVQKTRVGWFFNPDHVGLMDLSMANTLEHMQRVMDIVFYRDSNFFFWGCVLLLSLVAAVVKRRYAYLLLMVPTYIIYVALIYSFKDAVFYVCIVCLMIIAARILLMPMRGYTAAQRHFVKFIIATSLAYIYFCCINFFEQRYLFPAVLLLGVVLAAVLCDLFLLRMKPLWFNIFLSLLVGVGVCTFAIQNDELTIRDRILLQQELVDRFEADHFYDRNIFCAPFLERIHLLDAKTGSRHTATQFSNITDRPTNSMDLMVFDNIEENAPDSLRHLNNFYLLYRMEKGPAWVEVYKRTDDSGLIALNKK
jgi:hypothetical protein